MATTDQEGPAGAGDQLLEPLEPKEGAGQHDEGSAVRRLTIIGAVVVVVALLTYGSFRVIASMGGEVHPAMLTHKVQRGDLVISITEDGNLESASNVDIKCQVAGGTTILWIVEDGTEVKKGDKLVEFDSSKLEEQINQQKITYEKARAAVIQAEKNYEVAKLAVKEYLEGVYKKELQDQEAQITIALENLRNAQNALEYSRRMFRKGYISQLELESQEFAVQRAQLELDSARTAKEVLENFTKVKTLEDLNSQVETARAAMESEKAAFALEESRLKNLEEQLAHCVITAPQDGMVVYANERQRGRFASAQQSQIEEGAMVRERQDILRLPDLTQMQVKVNVHESKVDSLRVGMRARIRILDRELQGKVTAIANQPEPTSFFSAAIKEYGTWVKIDGQPKGLKPGMTAEVEILVAHLQDVLSLPVAAVVEQRGKFYCWVKTPDGIKRRELKLGMSNDKFIEVKEGVQEGEEVILNPRSFVAEAREEPEEREEVNVQEKFGVAQPAERRPGEGPRGGPETGRPGAREGGPGLRPGGGAGGGGSGRAGFEQLDADGDGKISKEEAPERMREFFDRIDSNGDGFIDQQELSARRRSRPGGGAGGGGGGLMRFDQNGDGKLSRDEAPSFLQDRFDQLDGNGDGVIDSAEVEALRSRAGGSRPGGGGGGRGRGGF